MNNKSLKWNKQQHQQQREAVIIYKQLPTTASAAENLKRKTEGMRNKEARFDDGVINNTADPVMIVSQEEKRTKNSRKAEAQEWKKKKAIVSPNVQSKRSVLSALTAFSSFFPSLHVFQSTVWVKWCVRKTGLNTTHTAESAGQGWKERREASVGQAEQKCCAVVRETSKKRERCELPAVFYCKSEKRREGGDGSESHFKWIAVYREEESFWGSDFSFGNSRSCISGCYVTT